MKRSSDEHCDLVMADHLCNDLPLQFFTGETKVAAEPYSSKIYSAIPVLFIPEETLERKAFYLILSTHVWNYAHQSQHHAKVVVEQIFQTRFAMGL